MQYDFKWAICLPSIVAVWWHHNRTDLPQYSSWHLEFGCSAFTTVTTPSILLHSTGRSDTMTGQQSIFPHFIFTTSSLRLWQGGRPPCHWCVSQLKSLRRAGPGLPLILAWRRLKAILKRPFCAGSYSKFLSTLFLLRPPRFLRFESEIRLPGWVAMKTVRQCRNVPFYFSLQQTTPACFHISASLPSFFCLLPSLRIGWFVEEPSESSLLLCKCRRQRPTAINTYALSKWKPWIIQSNSDNKKQLLYELFKHCDGSSRHAFESRSRQAEMHSDKQTHILGMRREAGDWECSVQEQIYL